MQQVLPNLIAVKFSGSLLLHDDLKLYYYSRCAISTDNDIQLLVYL